jgi:hypothetical protein
MFRFGLSQSEPGMARGVKSKTGIGNCGAARTPAHYRFLLLLKIQAPKVHRSFLQFKAEFPTRPAFVPSPNQDGFAFILVYEINKLQALSNGKPLWDDRQASLRTGIHSVSLGSHGTA